MRRVMAILSLLVIIGVSLFAAYRGLDFIVNYVVPHCWQSNYHHTYNVGCSLRILR